MLKKEQRARRRKFVERLEYFPSFVEIGAGASEYLQFLNTSFSAPFLFGGLRFVSLLEFAKTIFDLSSHGGSCYSVNNKKRRERRIFKSKLKQFQGLSYSVVNFVKDEEDDLQLSEIKFKHCMIGDQEDSFWWKDDLIFWNSDNHRKLVQAAMRAMIFQNCKVKNALRLTARKHLIYRMNAEEKKFFPFSEERFGQIWERIRPAVIIREKKYNKKRERKLNAKIDFL